MRTRQREFSQVVVESCGRPCGCRMASAAIVIKVILLVIGILGCRELRGMAGIALRRGVGKPAAMTVHAGDTRMRTGEQKTGGGVIKAPRLGG